MGELILCNQEIAAMPYYLESVSCNVYSLEELSYCIETQLYLIDAEIMNEELCDWIEKELKEKELAKRLKEIIQKEGSFVDFVELLLRESCYCEKASMEHILTVLSELQNKSAFECGKIRADRLMENKKYVHAILEYRRLLQMEEDCKNEPVLTGNIWHNMGSAFAKLFLFHEAGECFLKAYEKNQNHVSLTACITAYQCAKEQAKVKLVAEKYGISEEEQAEISKEWTKAGRNEAVTAFEQETDEIFSEGWSEPLENPRLAEIITNWKKEYNKNGRM